MIKKPNGLFLGIPQDNIPQNQTVIYFEEAFSVAIKSQYQLQIVEGSFI